MNTPFGTVMYLMAKPAGAACNLACEYCYYLEKGEPGKRQIMDDKTLELFVKQYIEAQTVSEVVFTWHGGEAMMRPLSFYEKAMELQNRYAGGRTIVNCLQTNGTLLTPQWCQFLKANGWLVGISIDGPREFHDEYRHTALGKPTFDSVMRGIRLLQQYGVEWNAMAVVNDYNVEHPREFYRFFKEIGCRYLQFTPIVERRSQVSGRLTAPDEKGELTDESVTPRQWGRFLCEVFDEWVRADVGKVFVQIFDATLAGWVGEIPGVCSLAQFCGHAGVIEHNGDVYACDHFVFPDYRLGNIHSSTLVEMMMSERQQSFRTLKRGTLPRKCLECEFTLVCNGECPKNRFVSTGPGEPPINYLCEGYRMFFRHVTPAMNFMAAQLKSQLPPADIMKHPELWAPDAE